MHLISMSGFALVMAGVLCTLPSRAEEIPASPTLSSNIAVVSNYLWRGIGQTSSNPAIQGGMDYAHVSGFYTGLWGSPVSWIIDKGAVDTTQYGSPTTQVNLYLGYRQRRNNGYGYDLGFIRYNFLGNYTAASGSALADTVEAYAAIHYMIFTAKYSYSVLDQFMTLRDTRGTNYIELNARYALPHSGYSISAHLGRQSYSGATAEKLDSQGTSASYTDFRLGIETNYDGYALSLSHSYSNASTYYTHAKTLGGNWAGPTTVLALSRVF